MTDKKPKTYEEGYEQGLIDYLKEMKTPSYKKGLSKAIDAPIRECYKRGFEQGKLAGKKELIDQMCKPMEEENALCDRRLGDCMPCEERKKRIKELKSQLKEEAKK